MKSVQRGKPTDAEVTRITPRGVTLRVDGRSYLLPMERHPWFRSATIAEISNVERPAPHHLRWPDLDVDLELDSIRHPERYPITFWSGPPRRSRVAERGPARR